HGFMYSFPPLPGYFSSFPPGTRALSVTREYLGLPGGPGRFTAVSTGPLLLGNPPQTRHHSFRLRDSHPLRQAIPDLSTNHDAHPTTCQSRPDGPHIPTHTTADTSPMHAV